MGVPCNQGNPQDGASRWILEGHPHWSHQSCELLGDNPLPWRLSPNHGPFPRKTWSPDKSCQGTPITHQGPPSLDFRIQLHWWASLGPEGMALVGLLPNGGLSILWLLRKTGLPKRKETLLEREHLLLHSKVKPSKLHHHASYG